MKHSELKKLLPGIHPILLQQPDSIIGLLAERVRALTKRIRQLEAGQELNLIIRHKGNDFPEFPIKELMEAHKAILDPVITQQRIADFIAGVEWVERALGHAAGTKSDMSKAAEEYVNRHARELLVEQGKDASDLIPIEEIPEDDSPEAYEYPAAIALPNIND